MEQTTLNQNGTQHHNQTLLIIASALLLVGHLRQIVATALNTGMRKAEILLLRWSQVDLQHGFILLDKTKNGELSEIPVNGALKAVFQSLRRRIDVPSLKSHRKKHTANLLHNY